MLLKSELAPVVGALIDARGDARDAVNALVLEAAKTSSFSTSTRMNLLEGAQAIALAAEQRDAAAEIPDELRLAG